MIKKSLIACFIILLSVALFYPYNTLVSADQLSEVPDGYIGVYTVEDLNNIRGNLSGNYILMNDIDLSSATSQGGTYYNSGSGWEPIGTKADPFTGVLDGNGYQVTGMKINIKSDQEIYAGLFGYGKEPTIKNIEMVNSVIEIENTSVFSETSDVYAGSIIGYIDSLSYNDIDPVIENANSNGSVRASSMFDSYAGGLIGYAERTIILGSSNSGTIEANNAGGIVGEIRYDGSTIKDSDNLGDITGNDNAGGITSYFSGTEIRNTSNTGKIKGSNLVGGIVGSSSSSIIDSVNKGIITSDSDAGGIAGRLTNSSTIIGSRNTATIQTDRYGGGIVGYLGNSSIITDSYNNGNIISDLIAGGIAGILYNSTIQRTYNTGDIEGNGHSAGGITASNGSNSKIQDSYNIGYIKAQYNAGGIAGTNEAHIKNTYNIGDIYVVSMYPRDRGGIVGENKESGTQVINNYYLNTESYGIGSSTGMGSDEGTLKSTFEQLLDPTTFLDFDYQTTWTTEGNEAYHFPELSNLALVGAEEEMIDIIIKSEPDKDTYIEGENFDVTGTVIETRSNFGTTTDVEVTTDMVSGYDTNRIGTQWLTVTYHTETVNFRVEVKGKDRTPPQEVTDLQADTTTDTVEVRFKNPSDTDFTKTNVYLYGELVGETTSGTYQFEGLTSNTQYPITITTVDDKGNESDGVSITAITKKSFVDKLLDKVDQVMEKLTNAIDTVKLWEYDTAKEGKEHVPDNKKEELEQQLEKYKASTGLKDMTEDSPTLRDMEPMKVLKIDFSIPIDPSTVVKNENVYIRHQAEFVEGIDLQVTEDGKSVYIFAPTDGYPEGEYSLYVDTSVKSEAGVELKNPIVVNFEL
ncbi:Ig-like domain (group 3) [Oceanobacillus limi]|uniref:Ig-like domain (Group 3) n=1 Tax=Oceanobacillus limi TaxID=930131 RepID=A0A1I0A3F9_9BACI|nr:bacterial Ig-like domain-containing protein [Oceanobacillus limi]SES88207.1 Ig-like domain (group 3) [Oceanobacillus limi]